MSVPPDHLIAFQEILQLRAPWDVVVPFVDSLATTIGKFPGGPRIMRDFARLVSLIKTVAVINHTHRHRDADGRLLATLDDYAAVYGLVKDVFSSSATGGAGKMVREVVKAVGVLRKSTAGRVTVTKVAQYLKINNMAASRRIVDAEKGGWLIDQEKGRSNIKDLNVGEPLPPEIGIPSPSKLNQCYTVTLDTLSSTKYPKKHTSSVEGEASPP